MLATGQVPGTARLAVAMGVVAFGLDLFAARRSLRLRLVARAAALNIVLPVAILRSDLWAGRPQNPDCGQYRAVAPDRRGDRTVPLSHRVSADRAHLGAGAADRFRRLPSRAAGPRAGVLRRRRPARTGAVECRADDRAAALHRPEHRGLWPDHRLHRRAVAVLRLHADGQGAARHRRQPPRRPPRRHPHHAVGTDRLPARLRDRRDLGNPDRADHHALLRHRLPDRPEGLHRRHHRRAGQLSAHRGRGADRSAASRPSPRSMPAISRRSSSSR